MAQRLADAVAGVPGTRLLAPVEANGVFIDVPLPMIAALRARGWQFYEFIGATGIRLMCSWDTTPEVVDALAADIRALAQGSSWRRRPTRRVVVFDLGGVLLDWNPRHLYRKLFAATKRRWRRSSRRCARRVERAAGRGRPFAEAVAELAPQHRDKLHLINAWRERFGEMIPGAIEDTVEVLRELKSRGVPLYALTNWSAETFPGAAPRFPFLAGSTASSLSGAGGAA